jgi:hypothetical protein
VERGYRVSSWNGKYYISNDNNKLTEERLTPCLKKGGHAKQILVSDACRDDFTF